MHESSRVRAAIGSLKELIELENMLITRINTTWRIIGILPTIFLCLVGGAFGQESYIPKYRTSQILTSSAEHKGDNYFAFPAILRTEEDHILISYKRGTRHGGDGEAGLEMLEFNTKENTIISRTQMPKDRGIIHQMGEWNKFPDGTIRVYIDAQNVGHDNDNYRTGLREINVGRIDNRFTPSESKVSPKVGDREYGYAFGFINKEDTTFMLVMGFGYRPGGKWSVDVVSSVDNGRSWQLVRDLTKEFGGYHINESAFLPWKDGYVVTTREYGTNQRIYRTDKNFAVLDSNNLSKSNDFIESHLGRPRLFARDGNLYLLGRNWRTVHEERRMELALFKINPETLGVEKWVILDNADRANVTDGHYAAPYFQERSGHTYFNVINYRGVNKEPPSIVRHEFLWEEIK